MPSADVFGCPASRPPCFSLRPLHAAPRQPPAASGGTQARANGLRPHGPLLNECAASGGLPPPGDIGDTGTGSWWPKTGASLIERKVCSPAGSSSSSSSEEPLHQCQEHLSRLAEVHGVTLLLQLGRSALGQLGLFWPQQRRVPRPHPHHSDDPTLLEPRISPPSSVGPTPECDEVVIRVPLRLVLSDNIPGAASCPDGCIPRTLPWEIRLGALLLWASAAGAEAGLEAGAEAGPEAGAVEAWAGEAITMPRGARGEARPVMLPRKEDELRTFWSAYRSAFLPDAARQTSLLLWSGKELAELQDPGLEAAALAWQAEVAVAHELLTAGDSPYHRACGGRVHSLEEMRWAVGAVESRAFGVKVDGEVLQAMVPFFDLANHDARQGAQARHSLRALDGVHANGCSSSSRASGEHTNNERDSTGWQTLDMIGVRPAQTTGHDQQPTCSSSLSSSSSGEEDAVQVQAPAQGSSCEFFISYGEKGNRTLMEQYGFAVRGNPYNRLEDWLPTGSGASGRGRPSIHMDRMERVGRDSIVAAAARVLGGHALGGTAAAQLQDGAKLQPLRKDCGGLNVPGTSTEGGCHKLPRDLKSFGAAASAAEDWLLASRVQAVVASIIKVAGCRSMGDFKRLTRDGERGFLGSLRDTAIAELLAAPNSLQEDAAMLEAGIARENAREHGDIRLTAAGIYRLERKLYLNALVRVVEEALR